MSAPIDTIDTIDTLDTLDTLDKVRNIPQKLSLLEMD